MVRGQSPKRLSPNPFWRDMQAKINALTPFFSPMVFCTGVLLALATLSPSGQADASVRILSAARATEADWTADTRRTEKLIRDEQGRALLLRLIEYE